MRRLLLSLLVVAVLVSVSASEGLAHVLITDSSNTQGVMLHTIPDDDPIAGKSSLFYFDTQQQLATKQGDIAQLSVRDSDGNITRINTKIDDSLITAAYTFPSQGVYELTLTLKSNGTEYSFTHSQRVTRGITMSALDKPSYLWAEMLVLVGGIGIFLLAVTFASRRKDIIRQSK